MLGHCHSARALPVGPWGGRRVEGELTQILENFSTAIWSFGVSVGTIERDGIKNGSTTQVRTQKKSTSAGRKFLRKLSLRLVGRSGAPSAALPTTVGFFCCGARFLAPARSEEVRTVDLPRGGTDPVEPPLCGNLGCSQATGGKCPNRQRPGRAAAKTSGARVGRVGKGMTAPAPDGQAHASSSHVTGCADRLSAGAGMAQFMARRIRQDFKIFFLFPTLWYSRIHIPTFRATLVARLLGCVFVFSSHGAAPRRGR